MKRILIRELRDFLQKSNSLVLGTLVVVVLSALNFQAQGRPKSESSLPSYQAEQQVSGVIRIWGRQDFFGGVVKSWEEAFGRYQPGVQFDTQLFGNASAIGGLYTGASDIALMGREIWPTEMEGFQQVLGYKPFEISVMTGSVDIRNHDFALVIFVHKDNPLARLTVVQLDAIFGADHRRSLKNVRSWGELGLRGEWANRPVHLYGYAIGSGGSQFFERAVLAGSQKWNCNLQEFVDWHQQDGSVVDAGQRILDVLAKDRYGIAFSSRLYENPLTKALALAPQEGSPYYDLTTETVRTRKYPLSRVVSIFINRAPGQPTDPKLKEFLHYVLSQEGQENALNGGYLPLTSQMAEQERRKLD